MRGMGMPPDPDPAPALRTVQGQWKEEETEQRKGKYSGVYIQGLNIENKGAVTPYIDMEANRSETEDAHVDGAIVVVFFFIFLSFSP